MTDLRKIIRELRSISSAGSVGFENGIDAAIEELEGFVQELEKDQFRRLCCDEKGSGWTMAIQRVIGKEEESSQ
jgi:hypothetical protein